MELKLVAMFFGLILSGWARYCIKQQSKESGSNHLIVRGDNNIVSQGYSAQKPGITSSNK